MYRYILFDLDGTLTDPKEGITRSVQYALHSFGIDEPDLDKLEGFIGPPLKEQFMEFAGFHEKQALRAVEKYRERFSVTGLYENQIYEGIPEMLERLQEKGFLLAVASSKPTVFVEKILIHFQIDEYFTEVVGSELDGTRSDKGDVIREALRRLAVGDKEKRRAVMVGDRRHDVEGAHREGIACIGAAFGYGGREELSRAGAERIVETVTELEQALSGQEEV